VTQFYDQYLASTGLRTTQFSILAKLKRLGPMTINALARELVMDRTTLGRTMLPLERDGLIAIKDGTVDRRSKELAVTRAGTERLRRAVNFWVEAQKEFEERFGAGRAADLRGLLGEVASCKLEKPASKSTSRRQQTGAMR
jgi:DNA-binding MarR family transcriptional regulator